MIWMSSEYLLFKMPTGESMAFSSEAIAVEIVDETEGQLSSEFVKQAANAVYHYFKNELGRETVTVAEFAEAMEKALDGFEVSVMADRQPAARREHDERVVQSNLEHLAVGSDAAFELTFFPRLRDQLRSHLSGAPRVVRFSGLRNCVKQLTGAKRWSPRCRALEGQIVAYMRECLHSDAGRSDCTLVVD